MLEKYFFPALTRLGEQKHLRAIRDGIVAILPLIIVGSFFLLLAQLPGATPEANWGPAERFLDQHAFTHDIFRWYVGHYQIFLTPYLLTMKLMALYAAFTISAALARGYSLDPVTGGLLGMTSMMMTLIPQNGFLPSAPLGGSGLFLAILLGLFSAEVYRLWERAHLFEMPEGVPPAVTQAFSAVVPMIFLVSLLWIICHVLGIDLQAWILVLLHPVERLGDSLAAVIVITLIIHLVWLAGIHGVSVMNALFLSLWIDYLEQNAHAMAIGAPLPYITAHPFYQWFVWIGGAGCTLGLTFLLLASKSKSLKSLGKLTFLPSLFNINEPIIFGLPIVLNPTFAIPFLLAPTSSGIIAYLAMKYGLVHKPYVWVPWTLPAPIGAFLSTGYDWRALILLLINLTISTLLYYPFVKQWERKQKETSNETA